LQIQLDHQPISAFYLVLKMSKSYGPDLKKYMDKHLAIKLNGNRKIVGVLRGYDQFMNLVLDNTIEEVSQTERNNIGMVVVRGNSVVMIEPLQSIS
jgi:small nuclear ribonucleoprotein G